MKRVLTVGTWCVLVVVMMVGLASVGFAKVTPGQSPHKAEIVPGRVTVQFADDVPVGGLARGFGKVSVGISSVDQLFDQMQVTNFRPIFPGARKPAPGSRLIDETGFYELVVPDAANIPRVALALMQNPHIKLAEPVWAYFVDATPNDLQYNSQWHMSPPGPDPQPYNAWNLERGADTIKVGIVDTGILYRHPDLGGNIWVNPGEDLDHDGVVMDTDDNNGVDDDGNGYVDDLIGYDFVSTVSGGVYPGEDGSVRDNDPSDFNGHGTHVAGIVAAMTNNALNVTGMAGGWYGGHRSMRGVRLVAARAGATRSDGLGTLNSNDIAAALDYCRIVGVNVINASFGGGSYSAPQAVAMGNCINAGISYIHSAGNDNVDTEGWQDQVTGVVTVASTTSGDTKSSFSNYGGWISVSAPGSSILSTVSNAYTPGTAYYDGTSMAAPVVAGLNALIRSMMPSLPREVVDTIIINTTDNIDALNPGYEGQLGTGRVNAFTALSQLANAKFAASVTDSTVPFTVQFTDQSPNSPTSWQWDFGDGGVSTEQNPSHTYTTPGIYDVSLKITEARGLGEEHLRRYIWARADTFALDSVMIDAGGKGVINVRYRNTAQASQIVFPFTLTNSAGIMLDSFSVAGTRSETFDVVTFDTYDDYNQRFTIRMVPSPVSATHYLQPDSGVLIKLHVHAPDTAAKGTVVPIDTATQGLGGSKKPKISTIIGDYWPVYKPGKIVIKPCIRGKVTCGPLPINLIDLSTLIAYLTSGYPAVDPYGGNVNGVGIIDLADLSYLINYLIGGGPFPPQ